MTVNEKYYEREDKRAERPTLDFLSDVGFIDELAQNFGNEVLPRIKYYSLEWASNEPTNIYREKVNKTFKVPIYVIMNAELNPPEKELDKFGIQYSRDIKFSVSMTELKKKNILPKVGDQLYYDNTYFTVFNPIKEAVWAGSLQYVNVHLFCNYNKIADDAEIR